MEVVATLWSWIRDWWRPLTDWWSSTTALWLVATLGTLAFARGLARIDTRLKSRPGRYGIVGFELAFTRRRARAILLGWGESGRADARRSLRCDFGFIVFYTLLLVLLVRWAAGAIGAAGWWNWGGLTVFVTVVVAGAAVLDGVENVLLLRVLTRRRDAAAAGDSRSQAPGPRALPAVAGVVAALKFMVILGAVLFVVVGAAAWLGRPSS